MPFTPVHRATVLLFLMIAATGIGLGHGSPHLGGANGSAEMGYTSWDHGVPATTGTALTISMLVLGAIVAGVYRGGRIGWRQALLLLSAGLILNLVVGGLLIGAASLEPAIVPQLSECNAIKPEYRFSCYRSIIEDEYGSRPEQAIGLKISPERFDPAEGNASWGVYGPNCHTFYHALGDFIAEETIDGSLPEGPIQEQLERCPTRCRGGCVMGWANRMAMHNEYSTDWLKRFYTACKEGQLVCAHEVGHLLADKHIASHLKLVDEISRTRYGLDPEATEHYVPFDGSFNITAAYDECRTIVRENEQGTCFTGVGHSQFIYSEYRPDGRDGVLDMCSRFGGTAEKECYSFILFRIGINDAAPAFIRGDFDTGNRICREKSNLSGNTSLEYSCFRGIGSGMGLFIDSRYAPVEVTGNNRRMLANRILGLIERCEKADLPGACYAGILGPATLGELRELNVSEERIDSLLARRVPPDAS